MIRIWFFASIKCPPLRFSCFFSIFSNLFACRALSFLISELFISTPCCHVFLQSNKLSFSVLWLQLLFHYYLSFYIDLQSLTVRLIVTNYIVCHCLFIERNSNWNTVHFIKMSNIYDSSISIWANWTDISNRCKSWIRFYKVNCQV